MKDCWNKKCNACLKHTVEIMIEKNEALSEMLACFSDEDVIVTTEMKEKWLRALDRTMYGAEAIQ
jgi:hypothetical protein